MSRGNYIIFTSPKVSLMEALAQEPPKIRVVVRKRPLTAKEERKQDRDILELRGP